MSERINFDRQTLDLSIISISKTTGISENRLISLENRLIKQYGEEFTANTFVEAGILARKRMQIKNSEEKIAA